MKKQKQIITQQHKPVMLEEVIEALEIKANGIYVDATFGRGGHSKAILEKINKKGLLIAIDKDLDAVNYAKSNFSDTKLKIFHSSFKELKNILENLNLYGNVDAILIDLGISSPQVDCANRGFSFNKNGPLDMRMNKTQDLTAKKWLEESSEEDIANTLYQLGEEKKSRIIASKIKQYQKLKTIETTKELADIITSVIKYSKNKHPATRSFQAIRMQINNEIGELNNILEQSVKALKEKGRLCVISFNSIEDRIVKQFIQKKSDPYHNIPKNIAITQELINNAILKKIKKKKPSKKEILLNNRSRSAILRIAEKC